MEFTRLHPALADMLAEVEAGLGRIVTSESAFLSRAARQALSGRGKRLRPSLLLLSAECAGGAGPGSIALAGVVEVVHTASLVHDDVVDGAPARRGRRSANATWGNQVSVLLGDYLIARALGWLHEQGGEEALATLIKVAGRMCAGQVEELRRAGRLMGERAYFEIARAKTGSLFAFCGEAGAGTGGGSPEVKEALGRFGERFGVAFQVADDILDLLGSNGRSGKPEARDVREGKLTLPLIYAARAGGPRIRARLRELLAKRARSPADVQAMRELAEASEGVAQAWRRVRELLASARAELAAVPDGTAKRSLLSAAGDGFPMPVMT